MKHLDKKTLNEADRNYLKELLDRPVASLNSQEKAVIKARRDYLSESELKAYESVLKAKPVQEKKKEIEAEKVEAPQVEEVEAIEAK